MTKVSSHFPTWIFAALCLGGANGWAAGTGDEFFERRIRPVLAEQCFECHSSTSAKLKGGLKLDSRSALLAGGETGPAVVAGKPEESLLLSAMQHRNPDLTMPPKKPRLPASVLTDFAAWIRDGAVWPGDSAEAAVVSSGGFELQERKDKLPWIWKTPVLPALPKVKAEAWPRGPVDSFILSRLETEGLSPAGPAEPEVWLRRVYFALLGLPPGPAELEAFLRDNSVGARERVVDQLLSSPHFGERWSRHWLDLMRYAESRGHEGDYVIPNAYEYRDYVIRAFNSDVPYDLFVREHLAGDLLPNPRRHPEAGFSESVLGTGWAFLGEEIHAPVDTRLDETERIDNRIDVLSKSFLGLTVSCARCHDHKFDAISQRDYYALAGFFLSSGQRLVRFQTLDEERRAAERLGELRSAWRPIWAAKLRESAAPVFERLSQYLVAAAEAGRARSGGLPASNRPLKVADLAAGELEAIRGLSVQHSLDSGVLTQWTLALLNAVSNRSDLLHPLASLALLRSLPATGREPVDWELGRLPEQARVVFDLRSRGATPWITDGYGFGTQPSDAGELRLVGGFSNVPPVMRLLSRGAAVADGDWSQLGFQTGVEREPAMYGGWVRDGAILRSQTFELKSGKLHYLAKGGGRVLAVVDSQRLVTGPLHTALVREWPADENWRWVSQDLSEYVGHRVALEISPSPGFDTALAVVVEAEKAPAEPWTPTRHFTHLLSSRSSSNTVSLTVAAGVYQEHLGSALRALRDGSAAADARLELLNWLTQRPELLSGVSQQWPEPMKSGVTRYLQERDEILARVPWKAKAAPAMWDADGVDEYLLVRGKHHSPKGLVPRRFLEAVSGPEPLSAGKGSGRLELAELMTRPTNPLLARVWVNRVWHHLFGRGIVASVDNFGWLGQRPSHPELLDYLAVSFMHEDHWSSKSLLRRLVLSRTFEMASKPVSEAAEARDPENVLLHRMNLKRLEAEAIRDAILSVSGRLNPRMYGPGVPLHESQFVEARGLRSERGPLDGDGRRSLYVAARRNFLPMMMTAFDMPIPFTTVGRRNVSNVPGQMLFLMNDPFVHQQAEVWARRITSGDVAESAVTRLRRLFLESFSREPSPTEVDLCRQTLARARSLEDAAGPSDRDVAVWTELCHALLGAKEFIFIR